MSFFFFLYHVPIFFLIRECVLYSLFDELLSISFFFLLFFLSFFLSPFFYFSIFFLFLFFIFFLFLRSSRCTHCLMCMFFYAFRICWWYSFLDELGALTYKLFLNFFYQNLILNFKWLMILIWGIWKKYIFFGSKRVQRIYKISFGYRNMAIYHFESWLLDFQRV